MRNSNVVELNSTLELLNENELYSFKGGLAGGQSETEIPEVIIPAPDHGGNDDGDGGFDDGSNPPGWNDDDPPGWNDGDDPFPPDGGGIDDNNTPPPPNNLPGTLPAMCQQASYSGSCAIRALDWVGKYLGVSGLNKDDFAEFFGAKTPADAFNTFEIGPGTTPSQYLTAINSFFTSDNISSSADINTHVGQGHPVLATLIMPDGGLHAAVITGIDVSTGMVTMANSLASGGFETVAFGSLNIRGLNAITGVQNNSVVTKYTSDTGDWWTHCSIY